MGVLVVSVVIVIRDYLTVDDSCFVNVFAFDFLMRPGFDADIVAGVVCHDAGILFFQPLGP